jgi:type II secretory pathway component PulM
MMVLSAVFVVGIGLLYTVGIEPAWDMRIRLARDLPRLQDEVVQLEALRAEVRGLEQRSGGVQTRESLRAAAEQSLRRANLVGEVVDHGANAVTVNTRNIAAAKWFNWLESFAREARIKVVTTRIERASPGRVDARVAFQTAVAK